MPPAPTKTLSLSLAGRSARPNFLGTASCLSRPVSGVCRLLEIGYRTRVLACTLYCTRRPAVQPALTEGQRHTDGIPPEYCAVGGQFSEDVAVDTGSAQCSAAPWAARAPLPRLALCPARCRCSSLRRRGRRRSGRWSAAWRRPALRARWTTPACCRCASCGL